MLSGLLLWLSWPVFNTTVMIFIAFVPLLYAADFVKTKTYFFFLAFISTLIWNIGATWWVINSTEFAVAAFVCNALLMCIPLLGYFIFKRKYGLLSGSIALIVFWMSFEYLHLNWQLSWPWLTLGNVFAGQSDYILWYSYTGVAGGTLWVLITNLLIKYIFTECVEDRKENKWFSKMLLIAIVIIVTPVVISNIIYSNSKEPETVNKKEVIIVQPNIDPYQKFDPNAFNQQIDLLISLSENNTDSNTALILWPETALSQQIAQNDLKNSLYYKKVFDFLNRHPKVTLQSGIDCYSIYNKAASPTARKISGGMYVDAFNSAVALKAGHPIPFYNKSKLVPGVETLPTYFKFLASAFEKFGGTSGGYGKDSASKVFTIDQTGFKTAPIICYESIYGEYVSSYAAKGANLLTIMTNDGWWGNTPGYKQHLEYARLRAIETNSYVIRSANTGISAVIDHNGKVLITQPWDKAAVIKTMIPVRSFSNTFYTLHGDYMFLCASILAAAFLLFHLLTLLKSNINKLIK